METGWQDCWWLANFLGHRRTIPGRWQPHPLSNHHQGLHYSCILPGAMAQLNRIEITNHTTSGNSGKPYTLRMQVSSIHTDDKCPLELPLKRPISEFTSERTSSLKLCSYFWSPTEVRTAWSLDVLQWKKCNLCLPPQGWIEATGFIIKCVWLSLHLQHFCFQISLDGHEGWKLKSGNFVHVEVLGSVRVLQWNDKEIATALPCAQGQGS